MATRTLTPDLLAATGRQLNRLFDQLYAAVDIGPWAQLYNVTNSNSAGENYPTIGATPMVAPFTGTRTFSGIRTDGFYVLNEDFDAGIEVLKADIERDQLGKYTGAVQEMVAAAATYPATLLAAILANATSTSLAKCWDGAALASASHGVGDGAGQTNIVSGSGVDTIAHVQSDIAEAASLMIQFKNDKGNFIRGKQPNIALYPAANFGLGLLLDTLRSNRGALDTADQSRYLTNVIAVPELTGNTWYLAAGGGGIRPFGYQQEVPPRSETTYDFDRKTMKMSVEMRGAAYCADWTAIVQVHNS